MSDSTVDMILATRPLVDNEIDPGLLESSFVLPTHGHGGPQAQGAGQGQGQASGQDGMMAEEDGAPRIPKTSSNTTNSASTSAGGRRTNISTTHIQQHGGQDTDIVEEPVKFVLLAEFDIDQGATLTHQYPFPTGTDEQ